MQCKTSRTVKLNVGGKKFETSTETLLQQNPSFFSSLLKNSVQTENREFFIDRDPKMFSMILNYMRTNSLDVSNPDRIDFSSLLQEAMFYQLDSLVLKINMLKMDQFDDCGNILFHGHVDDKDAKSIGIKIINNDPPIIPRVNSGGHRNCASVDLSSLSVLGSSGPEQVTDDMHRLLLHRQHHNRISQQIGPSSTTPTSETAPNPQLPSSPSQEFYYCENNPLNNQATIIKSHQKWMVVCYPFHLCLFWLCDINGWSCVWKSPVPLQRSSSATATSKSEGSHASSKLIHRVALVSKLPNLRRLDDPIPISSNHTHVLQHEALLAVATSGAGTNCLVSLHSVQLSIGVNSPVDYHVLPLSSTVTETRLCHQYVCAGLVDHMVFLGGHLLLISESQPAFGFWQCQARRWHNCSLNSHINCYSVMNEEFVILGCTNGGIYQLNAQKFPLRMSDNAVLYTEMFRDPSNDSITALDVYDNSQKCCSHVSNCLEIAYGTESGRIRIVVQHAGVSEGPKIFQTLTVHRSRIIRIVISEKYLISMCQNTNHIRSWLISRFRGTINTQPGTTSLASFHLMTLNVDPLDPQPGLWPHHQDKPQEKASDDKSEYHNDDTNSNATVAAAEDDLSNSRLAEQIQKIIQKNTDMGPFTDHLIFIQKMLLPQCNRIFVRLAYTGRRVCCVQSHRQLQQMPITAFCLHQSDLGGTVTLVTGHENGSLQLWDLSTALDQLSSAANGYNSCSSSGTHMQSALQPPTAASLSTLGLTNHCLRANSTVVAGTVTRQQRNALLGIGTFPGFDEPSDNGPTPRELFSMLREYHLSSATLSGHWSATVTPSGSCYQIRLAPCVSQQSLCSESMLPQNSTSQNQSDLSQRPG